MSSRISDLGPLIKQHRAHRHLSLRQAATEAEVPFNTLARVENGHQPDLDNFQKLTAWLGISPEEFFAPAGRRITPTPDAIAAHLAADPNLDAVAASKIADIVAELYRALARADTPVAMHLRAERVLRPQASVLMHDLVLQMRQALEEEADASPGI